MSLEKTSKLLAESRKVIEDSSNNVDNAAMLFNMVLQIVTSIDSRLKTIESGIETINEIKKDLLLISSTVRNLETVITETKTAQNVLENSCQTMSDLFDDAKKRCIDNSRSVNELDKENISICTHMRPLEDELNEFRQERDEMRETIIDLRCRSMKNNLVFTGLTESQHENTAATLRDFLRCELGIEYHIEFGNVHRFGHRQHQRRHGQAKHRFLYYNDLAYIIQNAKLLKGKPYGINQQFPAEIESRKRSLYPVMKEAKDRGKMVKMVRDKHYINNKEYCPVGVHQSQSDETMNFRSAVNSTPTEPRQQRDRQPVKRPRVTLFDQTH
jgi:hypothetical protein